MKNIAPHILRQRLLLEGYCGASATKHRVKSYLLGLAGHLKLKVYAQPTIFAPASGMGKKENRGFDAFVPLVDSGISAYFWSESKFLSVIIYTCKRFDSRKAVSYTKKFWDIKNRAAILEF